MKRGSFAAAVALALCGVATANASAATTRAVDDDGRATPKDCNALAPASPTIQGAVTASSSGDTIVVCPGTYVEQVTIPSGKDRLTLISSVRRQAIIKAPSISNADYNRLRPDLVRVEGAKDASFLRFTITGPLADDQFCNEGLNAAVHILGGGSANLVDNRITKARAANPALLGCQNGFGVQIGRRFEGQTGTGRLFGNEIDEYQKGGIYVDNVGSALIGSGNVVRGPDQSSAGPGDPLAATNGVQISRGADAYFDHNAVVDNVFPGTLEAEPGQASGLIIFNPSGEDGSLGHVKVSDNLVKRNDNNVGLFNWDKSLIEDNTILDATFYDGLYADPESEGNRFTENTALNNTEHDCHDDSNGSGTAGTANFWKDNTGKTQNRPGLCKDKQGHDGDHDGHGHGGQHGYMK
jgi:hypothetical protein